MTEEQLQADVLELCGRYGLIVLAIPDSRRIVHGKGWPDLVIAGYHSLLFAELKTEGGRLSSDQRAWRWKLLAAGMRWVLWRPCHLASGEIETELRAIA